MGRTTRASALEKQTRAIELHAEGKSFDEISGRLGYANRSAAWKAVDRGLRTEREARAADYLQRQLDRYATIVDAWWDAATVGRDPKAANVVLRVLERLEKLLHLDDREQTADGETIVISADPEQYVEDLKRIDKERERQAELDA